LDRVHQCGRQIADLEDVDIPLGGGPVPVEGDATVRRLVEAENDHHDDRHERVEDHQPREPAEYQGRPRATLAPTRGLRRRGDRRSRRRGGLDGAHATASSTASVPNTRAYNQMITSRTIIRTDERAGARGGADSCG